MSKKNKDKKLNENLPENETVEQVEEEIEETVEDINEEDELTKLKNEIATLKNDYLRAYADAENLKKRLTAENEQMMKYRIQSFAKEILPVIDNLERALKTEVQEADQGFYTGVKMTYDQLINALKNEGVEEIDCIDKPYDPNFEQSIMMEKVEGKEAGIVVEVLQKGYVLKDRILRPAMVKVSE